jgi:hypothetical protein
MPGWTVGYSHVVAKTWSDPKFRKQLLDHPRETLVAHGMDISPNVEITITPGNGRVKIDFPLPAKPEGIDADVLVALTSVPDFCC